MKKIILLLFAPLLLIALLGCEKNSSEEDKKIPEDLITFEAGEGGVFIGSVRNNEFFNFKISEYGNSTIIKSGSGHGRAGNKSLPQDCKITKQSFGQLVKLKEGKYYIMVEIVGKPETGIAQVEIVAGKCTSLEVKGVAW